MRAILSGGGRYDQEFERLPFLKRALAMAGTSPRLLIVPTPLKWPPFDEVDSLIATLKPLKIDLKTLTPDTQSHPDPHQAAELIHWANVILVLGGNFMEQMTRWRATSIDHMLIAAAGTDKVLVGGSTGLMCWFQYGHTNTHTLDYTGPSHSAYRFEPGLGVLPAAACAHYEGFHTGTGAPRAASFRAMMYRRPIGSIGIGVTTHASLEIDHDTIRILGDRYASVHRIERTPGGLTNHEYRPNSSRAIPFKEFFGRSLP
jgi:hypothetical protein